MRSGKFLLFWMPLLWSTTATVGTSWTCQFPRITMILYSNQPLLSRTSKGHGPEGRGHQWQKVFDCFCALWQKVTTDTYQSLLYQYVMPWLSATYLEGNNVFQQDVPQLAPQIRRRDSLGPTWLCCGPRRFDRLIRRILIAGLCMSGA